jgi:hypothetical protein
MYDEYSIVEAIKQANDRIAKTAGSIKNLQKKYNTWKKIHTPKLILNTNLSTNKFLK